MNSWQKLVFALGFSGLSLGHAAGLPTRKWYERSRDLSTAGRVEEVSRGLLSVPYGGDPLGEGPGARYDQDPLLRDDAFDCTTYVETVLAGALASSAEEVEALLTRIRYHAGRVDYRLRNHFTSLDWIPHVQSLGVLSEETASLAGRAGVEVRYSRVRIDKAGWYSAKKASQLRLNESLPGSERERRLEEWRAEGLGFAVEEVVLPYLRFEDLLEGGKLRESVARALPEVSVVQVVRPDWDLSATIGTALDVSHQVLVLRLEGGALRVRHASSDARRVIEEDFSAFISAYRARAARGAGSAQGLHFLRLGSSDFR